MVENPFFETDGGKRAKVISHISAMSEVDKDKYSFIWLAELGDVNSDAFLCQFDARGNEQNYSEVRERLNENKVAAVYFIPIKAKRNGYGVKNDDVDGLPGLIRRGYIKHNASGGGQKRGFAYRIEAGDKYLYVSDSGEFTVTSDADLNVVEYFDL